MASFAARNKDSRRVETRARRTGQLHTSDKRVCCTSGWELDVIQAEPKKPSLVGWYRNPTGGLAALAIPYTQSGVARTIYPDFLFFHEIDGEIVVGHCFASRGRRGADHVDQVLDCESGAGPDAGHRGDEGGNLRMLRSADEPAQRLPEAEGPSLRAEGSAVGSTRPVLHPIRTGGSARAE